MILDIKKLSDSLITEVKESVQKLKEKPSLTIIMVGNNNASEVYVRNKIKTCNTVGIDAQLLHLEESVSSEEIQNMIQKLNDDTAVDGILVQSPLPDHINAQEIFDCINPRKDVDGFSSENMARLYSGDESGLVPGTPKGIMKIIQHHGKIAGKHAVVIGKSTIVGKPLAMLMLHAGATVTICHSRTEDLGVHTKNADIVISAVGRKHLITADMIRPNSLVVDVGINVEENNEGRKLFGDCDTENIEKIADITPVPGGVGPMTIAMLLSNVLQAHTIQ
jgi:methylenetetrahydrofolate dehydrogenase (NADP+)/methenyltetrahydrofolate cyclohydrolase